MSRNKFINDWVAYLYLWIIANLYDGGETLATSQHKIIIEELIAEANTYQGHYLKNFHFTNVQTRLKKWKNFVDRDKKHRFTPLPMQFFSQKATKGYLHTMNWLKQDNEKIKRNKLDNWTNRAIRKTIKMMNPNKTAGQKYHKATLPYNQLMAALQQHQKVVETVANKYNRPDIAQKYVDAINEEMQTMDWGNYV